MQPRERPGSSPTAGFKCPRSAWNFLEDADHMTRSFSFQLLLGVIQNGRQGLHGLFVRAHTYNYVRMYGCICSCICAFYMHVPYIFMYIMCVSASAYMYAVFYIYIYIHTHTHTYCVYIFRHMYMYIHTLIYIYIYIYRLYALLSATSHG